MSQAAEQIASQFANANVNYKNWGSLFLNPKVYGAKGDGVADDTAAFVLVESAVGTLVLLPEGNYKVTGLTLTKVYLGPGKVVLNAAKQAPINKHVTSLPQRGTVEDDYWGGDQKYIEAEHFVIDALAGRSSPTSYYYNWELIPHLINFDNYAGYSGVSTNINANSNAGTNVIFVRNTSVFSAGQEIVIGDNNAARREVKTIQSVGASSITLTSNLTYTHTAADHDYVGFGTRTMHSAYHTNVNHFGGGDAYAHLARIVVAYTPEAGQDHFAKTATGAIIGGDLMGISNGVYLTGTEINLADENYLGTYDIAAIGDVRSFVRKNDTASFGNVWLGALYKSEGTKWADSAFVAKGRWKAALDTVNLILDANKSAIRMGADQRIYFDGSATPDGDGNTLWGNNAGDTYMGYNSGTGGLEVFVDAVQTVIYGATSVFLNKNAYLGQDLLMWSGQKIVLDRANPNTYFVFDGTNVKLFKGGTAVATW